MTLLFFNCPKSVDDDAVFSLSGIALQNATQIDPPLTTQNATCAHLCAIQKNRSCLTETLNIAADGNGLKMQSSIRPFWYLVFGFYWQDKFLTRLLNAQSVSG